MSQTKFADLNDHLGSAPLCELDGHDFTSDFYLVQTMSAAGYEVSIPCVHENVLHPEGYPMHFVWPINFRSLTECCAVLEQQSTWRPSKRASGWHSRAPSGPGQIHTRR